MPVSSNQGPDKRCAKSNSIADQARPASVLTIDSQLRLRALYEFIDAGRASLDGINADLSLHSGASECLRRSAERLKTLCIDADSWGFDALYEIAWRLQMLLLDCSRRPRGDDSRDVIQRAMGLLSSLLEQCESDFRRRLAVAEVLENMDQVLGE